MVAAFVLATVFFLVAMLVYLLGMGFALATGDDVWHTAGLWGSLASCVLSCAWLAVYFFLRFGGGS